MTRWYLLFWQLLTVVTVLTCIFHLFDFQSKGATFVAITTGIAATASIALVQFIARRLSSKKN